MDDTVEGEGRFVQGESGDVGPDKRSFAGDDGSGTEAEQVVCSRGVQHRREVLNLATKRVELSVRTALAPPSSIGHEHRKAVQQVASQRAQFVRRLTCPVQEDDRRSLAEVVVADGRAVGRPHLARFRR